MAKHALKKDFDDAAFEDEIEGAFAGDAADVAGACDCCTDAAGPADEADFADEADDVDALGEAGEAREADGECPADSSPIVEVEVLDEEFEGEMCAAAECATSASEAAVVAIDPGKKSKKSKKKEPKKELPRYMRKSRRTRRLLVVLVVLLLLLIGALAYLSYQLVEESRQLAEQHAQEQQSLEEVEKIQQDVAQDASTEAVKKTSAPNLAGLMGCTQDEALEKLQQHGAVVTSTKTTEPPAKEEGEGDAAAPAEPAVEDDGDPVKTSLTVALTAEPVDTRAGTPTVYLGLDKDGLVIQAGYSASAAALGYGAYSFVDAVKNNYIIERTLQEAGIAVPEGTAQLPEDKLEYSTYADDGTTLMKEYCPFSGMISIDGKDYLWSSVLSYDYSVANAAGDTNLSDVIRIIYIYLEVPLS